MSRVAKPRTARPTKPGRKPRKKKTPPPPPLHARWLARITRFARIPSAVYLSVALLLSLVLVPGVNWLYQVVRKPSELFFPVSDDLYKTPTETWASYGPLFLAHSTSIMTPELLAALAQKEASGNPVARTYWRWATTLNLFEIYRPASSAVGMYQFTDGTFEEAKRYCIHDHRVVADGPWHDMHSCWFNNLYARVIPSHAVELAASNLDRRVREILARQHIRQASLRQQQELAILTHLCGAGAAARYAATGLRLASGQRCGDHDPRQYIERVMGLTQVFARLRQ
ncbi:MAG: transglycosylase SLT domain-containing protein [Gammaproteobacteria bacterium]|nr:transglycosylase SLT domain-containing protein [Gammaproteobacteria bacterium]